MNSVRSNSLSLKNQGFPPLGCQDIRIRKFEFVAKTQVLNVFLTRTVVFGQSGRTKGPLLFFLGSVLLWAYPMYFLRVSIHIYNIYKVVIFVCPFVCLIITHKTL